MAPKSPKRRRERARGSKRLSDFSSGCAGELAAPLCKLAMDTKLSDLRCGRAPKAVLEHVNTLLNDTALRAKAARCSRLCVPLHEDATLRVLLEPWVRTLIKKRGMSPRVRLGRGPTSATMFPTWPPSTRRTGGGKLPAHQDYEPKLYKRDVAYSLIVLTKAVRVAADGPTRVYPNTRHLELIPKLRSRALQALPSVELTGEVGDAFMFDAAEYHEVLPVRPRDHMATRGSSSSQGDCGDPDGIARCSLVVGVWSAGFDYAFKWDDKGFLCFVSKSRDGAISGMYLMLSVHQKIYTSKRK